MTNWDKKPTCNVVEHFYTTDEQKLRFQNTKYFK